MPSRRHFLILSGAGLLAGISGCSSTRSSGSANASDQTTVALALVNPLRAQQGLPPLRAETAARSAAADQAVRMAKAGQMTHLIGFNDSFLNRMKDNKVPLPAAENISAGQDTVARAVQAWVDSPKHLANMLGRYNGLGVAMARSSASGNRPYWAMVLSA